MTGSLRYQDAIEWIALNDQPTIHTAREMERFISVCLIADIFGYTRKATAVRVIEYRYNLGNDQ